MSRPNRTGEGQIGRPERHWPNDGETSEFLLRACHDLRTAVRAIRAHSELLLVDRGPAAPSDLAERLGFIAGGARRIDQVVDGLSDYSLALQIDAAAFQPVPMGALLRTALAKLDPHLSEREAAVTYSALPRIPGDADRLLWLLENLLRKALSTPGAAPRVHVGAEPDREGWLFSICVSGAAEPAELEEMFPPSARVGGSERAASDLGAAICGAIVERHGGSIWTARQPAGGITIFFTLRAE